jgi:magnesium-transporting ATPase (P-type)
MRARVWQVSAIEPVYLSSLPLLTDPSPAAITEDAKYLRSVLWSELQVGDIIRVDDGEEIPVDLVLLTSSLPNGACLIETSNLDGYLKYFSRFFDTSASICTVCIHIYSSSYSNHVSR